MKTEVLQKRANSTEMKQETGGKLRISRPKELSRLFRHGRRSGDHRLVLIGLANPANGPSVRLGVAVSKRHGTAVRRNRIKRLCREAFRLIRRELPEGFDFVMIPRVGVESDLSGLKVSLAALARQVEEMR